MAEKAKGAVDEEAEVYEFEGMDDLIQFRKKFPKEMKYEYHYILSGGTKIFRHIALVEANHFKQFKKLVNPMVPGSLIPLNSAAMPRCFNVWRFAVSFNLIIKVDIYDTFWGEEFILFYRLAMVLTVKRRSKVMKKFICNRNGKAVFQEGDRELVPLTR